MEAQAVVGVNEIHGTIEFKGESNDDPNSRFRGYVMTLKDGDKLAFAGTGSDYVPPTRGLAPAENNFG